MHLRRFTNLASTLASAIFFTTWIAHGQEVLLTDAGTQSVPDFRLSPASVARVDGKENLSFGQMDAKESLPEGSVDGKEQLPEDSRASVEVTGGGSEASVARPFKYSFRLTLRGIYDDNINLTENNRLSDYYFAIEPGITVGFGDVINRQENYVRLDYAPSFFIYSDHSERDAVQHLVRLDGRYRFRRLTLDFSQDVQLLDGTDLSTTTTSGNIGNFVNLDVSSPTRVNIFTTHLDANYELGGKTFLTGGLTYTNVDYETLISSRYYAGNIFINYNYSPKLVIGVGGSGGYTDVDSPNPDQTFEQANVRVSYQATGKISLNASAGVEFRQFQDSSRGGYTSPVYELGATYQPFDGTTLSLTGSRRSLASAVLSNQDYAASSIIFGARQRFLQRFFVGVTAGYENSEYFTTIGGGSASRSDDYFFVQPAVDFAVTRFWTAGLYYLYRENDSSLNGFSFYDNQVGVRSSLSF